ncbi:hypothetical protein PR048_022608 [Dryococelus australis]|uniref:Protein AATF n=1 Tax=Dryococelus australis TaxID=614101 RepID=A0ABQ9H1J1_9NEOP|nr:hypothetical protein PR048_022608 [Dryococelus australis]
MGPAKKTVINDLLDYINPKPATVDSDCEFDADVGTRQNWYVSSEDEEQDPLPSRSRKRPLDVSEYDERYAGKKLSRSKLGIGKNQDSIGGFEEASSSGDDIESDAESIQDSEISGDSSEDGDGAGDQFQHLSKQNAGEEVEKGKAVKQQLEMWDSLLECRIKFQKCLVTANCLPRCDTFKDVMCDHDPELNAATQKTSRSVSQLLGKLIELHTRTLDLFTETASKDQGGNAHIKNRKNESDEEILSSEEDNHSAADHESQSQFETSGHLRPRRKTRTRNYSVILKEAHESYVEYRNSIIQKWNDKTRVAVGHLSNKNFSAFEQSTVRQIEQVLRDRVRLVQRSQLKRASYAVLGQAEGQGEEPERDAEVFDDGDWYQQLVRELIERKCAGVADPAQLGRQWLQLQKVRSKMRRKVDTRATKGRKVSYVVHPKLVSFMAPVMGDGWSDAPRTELYSSLFRGSAPL